jgi:hypothetical protein
LLVCNLIFLLVGIESMFKKIFFFLVIPVMLLYLAMVLIYNPEDNTLLACPVYQITGLECPGCGSQRAIHQLSRGEFIQAFSYNALLVVLLPYIFIGAIMNFSPLSQKYENLFRTFYGSKASYLLLFLIIAWTVIRNV